MYLNTLDVKVLQAGSQGKKAKEIASLLGVEKRFVITSKN